VLDDPAASCELADLRAVKLTVGRVVDVLDACARQAELGVAQRRGGALVLAVQPLGVDEHSEAFVEGKLMHFGFVLLLAPRSGHRVESHGLELFESRLCQHVWSSLLGLTSEFRTMSCRYLCTG
jgi:hypothetical protein